MSLQDQIAAVERYCYCSTNFFAQSVRLYTERDEELTVDAHVNYRYIEEDGYLVETCTVRILREDLPAEPAAGWRLYRDGDAKAFLWTARFEGRATGDRADTRAAYRSVFIRRTQQRAGGSGK